MSFVVAIADGIAARSLRHRHDLLGIGLAAALVGIGFGLICSAKYLDFDGTSYRARPLQLAPEDLDDCTELTTTIRCSGGAR